MPQDAQPTTARSADHHGPFEAANAFHLIVGSATTASLAHTCTDIRTLPKGMALTRASSWTEEQKARHTESPP